MLVPGVKASGPAKMMSPNVRPEKVFRQTSEFQILLLLLLFLARSKFCRLLINFANNLDPDQD